MSISDSAAALAADHVKHVRGSLNACRYVIRAKQHQQCAVDNLKNLMCVLLWGDHAGKCGKRSYRKEVVKKGEEPPCNVHCHHHWKQDRTADSSITYEWAEVHIGNRL